MSLVSGSIFKVDASLNGTVCLSDFQENLAIRVTDLGTKKLFEIVKVGLGTSIFHWIASVFRCGKKVHQYITGQSLIRLVKNAANGLKDKVSPELVSNPEFRKFARGIRGIETGGTKLRRAVQRLGKLTKGLKKQSGKMLDEHYWPEAFLINHPYMGMSEGPFEQWKNNPFTHLSFEDWLEHNSVKIMTVAYLDGKQREKHTISFKDGKAVQDGKAFDTALHEADDRPGKAIFVIGMDEQMYAGSQAIGQFHHSSFLLGGVVLGAGDIRVTNGEVVEVTNFSGHYRPAKEQLFATLKFLTQKGVNLEKVKVREKTVEDLAYSYNSAKTYLESNGKNPPDGCNGVEFIRTDGVITGLLHPDFRLSKSDKIRDVTDVVKALKLDSKIVKYYEKSHTGEIIESSM